MTAKLTSFNKIPQDFILSYITDYRRRYIQEEWYMYQLILKESKKRKPNNITKTCKEISEQLNMEENTIFKRVKLIMKTKGNRL
jgi:hypothetical protein